MKYTSLKNLKRPSDIFILLGPVIFLLTLWCGPAEGMSEAANAVLATTLWVAIWWVTEAVPIPVTSLLPLVLFPISGAMTVQQAALPYSKHIIFLFIGGFIIALAMEKWNLHKRIALTIISWVGTNMRMIILGFVLSTWILSLWISNTATTLMMLPIAISIILQFENFSKNENIKGADVFGIALILSIAYTASIGGMGTLVGTPTNLIFADSLQQIYNYEISMWEWMKYGVPVSFILMVVCWWHISNNAFSLSNHPVKGSQSIIQNELQQLGKITPEEKWVLVVFGAVAMAWILGGYVIKPFFPKINDTVIALLGAVTLFVIPSASRPSERLMDWKTALKLPWGILLLFGGAFAIAAGFEQSGLTNFIGQKLHALQVLPLWLILFIVVAFVNFLTEITQNMGTCTLIMPIMAALAEVLNAHPYGLMAGACVASSCAFMLPVATAPNAIVFGSGMLKMKDMIRAGFLLNVISIFVITLLTYFILPYVWGLDLLNFPEALK